jgi:hypothetical protein
MLKSCEIKIGDMATGKGVQTTRDSITRRGRISTVLMMAGGVPLLVGFDQGIPALLAFAVFLTGGIWIYTTKCVSCRRLLGMFAVGEVIVSLKPNPAAQACPHCGVSIDRRITK